jgi:hypothetical protein
MNPLEVEYRLSLNWGKWPAYWNIKKDLGTITQYLPSLWGEACNHSMFFETDHPDICFDNFMQELIYTEIVERICIERAHEGIRMKGRTRCKPNCCVRRAALMMYDPDQFKELKKYNPINAEEIKVSAQ